MFDRSKYCCTCYRPLSVYPSLDVDGHGRMCEDCCNSADLSGRAWFQRYVHRIKSRIADLVSVKNDPVGWGDAIVSEYSSDANATINGFVRAVRKAGLFG